MSAVTKIYEFQKDLDNHMSTTSIFILKCIVVAMCITYTMDSCYPKYEFIDHETRGNKITGVVEHNHRGGSYNWRE
jgi:hypothetical protein